MPTIRIPTPLRPYTGDNNAVAVTGETAGLALHALTEAYPALSSHLFIDGKLRSFVNVYLDNEDIRYLKGLDTPVAAEDTLLIVPSIAGGL